MSSVSSASGAASVTSLGVGSGLPLEDLMTSLQNAENTKLKIIDNQRATIKDKISGYGKIQSSLSALNSAIQALGDPAGFGSVSAKASGSDFTATAVPGTVTGTFQVQVNSLAKSQVLLTHGVASMTAPIVDASNVPGTISFSLGGQTKTLDLSATDGSLGAIVSAINSDSTLGVRASIVNDGSANPYRMMLVPASTGTAAAITDVSVAGNTALESLIGFGASAPGSTVTEQAASNANITLNGVAITSSTNTLSNVMQGLTLNLNAVSTSGAQALTVANDADATVKKITEFVNAYNSVMSQVKMQTAYNAASKTGSALTGDGVALMTTRRLSGVTTVVNSANTVFKTLSSIGITTSPPSNEIQIDSTKLNAALSSNSTEVKSLFQGANGVVGYVKQAYADLAGSSGSLTNATSGAQSRVKSLDSYYNSTSDRIALTLSTWRSKFTRLDKMVGQMNNTSASLSNQFASLQGTKK